MVGPNGLESTKPQASRLILKIFVSGLHFQELYLNNRFKSWKSAQTLGLAPSLVEVERKLARILAKMGHSAMLAARQETKSTPKTATLKPVQVSSKSL